MLKFKIHPHLDYEGEKKIKEFQLKEVKRQIIYCYKNSIFYKTIFDKNKIKPTDIKKLSDLQKIPLTTKEDLRQNNFDFICAKKEKWTDVFATTGTTGERIYFPQTCNDLSRTAYAELRCLTIAGIKPSDVVQFTYPMSTAMWGAGISYYLGYQLIGTCVLRYGPGAAEEQIENINKLGATVVHAQAGFLAKLGMLAKEKNIMDKLKVRLILPAIENLLQEDLSRNELGKQLESIWNTSRLCAVYGNTESAAPINECEYKMGYHITPEFCYYEVLDSQNYKPVAPGEKGVLVITPLRVEGLPLLRYNLGDISFLISGKCKCKRCAPRLGPILGRQDDMIKIKGVAIFPQVIEQEIVKIKEIDEYYIEVYKDEYYTDKIKIYLSIKDENLSGETPDLPVGQPSRLSRGVFSEQTDELKNALKSKLNITAEMEIKSKEEILSKIQPESTAKVKRFYDRRK